MFTYYPKNNSYHMLWTRNFLQCVFSKDNTKPCYKLWLKTSSNLLIVFTSGATTGIWKRNIIVPWPMGRGDPFSSHPTSERSLAENYYEMTTKSGNKLRRHWLCYSPSSNKAYCQPCWLFGTNSGIDFVTGFDVCQHLSSRL